MGWVRDRWSGCRDDRVVAYANGRRLRTRRLLGVPALLCAIVLLASAQALAQAPVGCGYGTGGNEASSLCWIDMTGYDDTQARSPAGQPFIISLPGGRAVTFTASTRDVPGFNTTTVAA